MNKPVKVLIVEDSEDDAKLALRALRGGGFEPTYRRVQTAVDMQAALAGEGWDAVISDFKMPGFTGMDALKILRAAGLDIPFILISGTIGEETAVQAMKAGASDYVMKKSLARLAPALERELKETQIRAAHRRDQEALADSEERFRQLAENISDAFFLQDAASQRMVYVSPAYAEIWDRSCASLQADPESWADAIHPDDRAAADAIYTNGVKTGSFENEYRIIRPDGSIRWIEARGFPVRDTAGKLVRIASTATDISERKHHEQEILATKTRLQGMLDALPDLLFELGLDGRYYAYHSPRSELLAAPAEELIGRTVTEVLPADAADSVLSALREANRTGHSAGQQFKLALPQGILWFELSVARMAIVHGQEPRFICLSRDITERKSAEQKFRDLLESAPDAMVIVNDKADMLLVNAQAIRLFGWRREELLGQKVDMLVPERVRAQHRQSRSGYFSQPSARPMGAGLDMFGLHKDGREFPVEISLSPLETSEGTLAIAAIRDITVRKSAEHRIRRLNRVYAVLSGINALIVREHDRDALFREACRVAVEAGGFRLAWIGLVDPTTMELVPVVAAGTTLDAGTLVNQRFSLLEPAPRGNILSARAIRDKALVFTNDVANDPAVVFKDEHEKRGSRSMAILPLVVSGEAVGVLALYAEETGFFDEEEMKLLSELAGDIAFAIDHIEKAAKLNYLAYYDSLTGLANRSLFLDRVTQYLRTTLSGKNKLAVFLIDLARFKNINDSLGRAAGDELLRQVAEWLTRKAAGDANQVARVGADQFAVVMPEVTQDCDVARHLETTMEALAEHPFHLNDSVFRIAARVGIAMFPDDGGDAETLFRNAEAALKLAKVRGERYLFYTQKMTDAVAGKLTLENQLRQALDNQEFVLHYQPKVSLASGKLTGAEALIRWNDPRTGLVPPGRFIPILEETGLIYEVGRWALRQAIADYLRWRAAGLPALRIAVNVSPLQLRNSDFIDEIARVIAIDEHAADGLELEITESVIMEDVKGNIASLQAIRDLGVRIAIDDFGTGFSSLSYLARLPVDTLKIDRSFVIEMTAGPEGLALVSTIISLAHSLKLNVVAEGVETEEQSRLLRLLDCDEMQGFLFSKPLPADAFEARFLAAEAHA